MPVLALLGEIVTMFLTNVMKDTAGQRHFLTQFELAVISFQEAPPPSLQSPECHFHNLSGTAESVIVGVLCRC